jgi:hypothetical protein
MTTALSPDKMILIQMILTRPIQKSGLCISSIRYLHLYVVLTNSTGTIRSYWHSVQPASSGESGKKPLTAVKFGPNRVISTTRTESPMKEALETRRSERFKNLSAV